MSHENDLIAALPATIPFVAPERIERQTGRSFVARIGANEGNFGPSPKAVEAMRRAAVDAAWKYGDPEAWELREALSARLGVAMDEIAIGQGIDGLLGLIVRIFSDVGSTIVSSLGAYPTFAYHVAGYGRQLVTVPYQDDQEDPEALAAKCQELKPAIVYLSNPDNPMGTWWPADVIERFLDDVPEETLIVLDEAYGETAPEGTLPALDTKRANLLRLRTFSKAYGMAGVRCGYAVGHRSLITPFDKVRDHFGVNAIALAAALASLDDDAWLAETLQNISDARDRIASIARGYDLVPIPSATNFVAIDCGGAERALALLNELGDAGVFIRKPMTPILDRCIRISVGRPSELDVLQEVFPEALARSDEIK